MKAEKKQRLEELARTLSQGVLDQTKEIKPAHECKVLEETIFMLQSRVNSLKATL